MNFVDIIEKEISAIETEIEKEKNRRRRTLEPGDLKRFKVRYGKIQMMLSVLSVYINETALGSEERNRAVYCQGQLEVYIKFYTK